MKYLKKLLSKLEEKKHLHEHEIYNYAIPSLWDNCDVDATYTFYNEKIVNPYLFYYENIKVILKQSSNQNYLLPLSKIRNEKNTNGEWIKKAFVYSMLLRTSSAYDHDHDGYITQSNLYELKENGTFLKTIALLPYLKELGINTLYLLPIFKTGQANKKGEFPSPYAISNFYQLDETLADTMIEMPIEEQCKAFIEACHILDIRVILDFAFRTSAIDGDLVKKHPEWFYWIDSKYAFSFVPLKVDTLSSENNFLEMLYKHRNTKSYLAQFCDDPKTKDPQKYEEIVRKCEEEHLDFLEWIGKEMQCSLVPGFSDVIMDTQDAWNDITYLRMYLDHPTKAQKYLEEKQAPYILYDVIKSNTYTGEKANKELWDYISEIIPYYQNNYGIDGARLDMGHAMPEKLVQMIIKKVKKNDADFCILAEEMDVNKDVISKEKGYDLLWGNGFSECCRIEERRLHSFYYNTRKLVLPVLAMSENHDSLRSAARFTDKTYATMIAIITLFMPNGIPFLNSGQEFYEIQPMNLGVDISKEDKWILPKDDYRYGKLALFDSFAFHYKEETLLELLKEANTIRQNYLDEICDISKNAPAWFDSPSDQCLGSWFIKEDRTLLMVANTNVWENASYNVHFINVAQKMPFSPSKCTDLFSTHKKNDKSELMSKYCIRVHLKAGEVKLICIR